MYCPGSCTRHLIDAATAPRGETAAIEAAAARTSPRQARRFMARRSVAPAGSDSQSDFGLRTPDSMRMPAPSDGAVNRSSLLCLPAPSSEPPRGLRQSHDQAVAVELRRASLSTQLPNCDRRAEVA